MSFDHNTSFRPLLLFATKTNMTNKEINKSIKFIISVTTFSLKNHSERAKSTKKKKKKFDAVGSLVRWL